MVGCLGAICLSTRLESVAVSCSPVDLPEEDCRARAYLGGKALEGAHLVIEHALDLPSHRVQAYHVVSVVYSTLWFRYEDTAVRRDDVHA